MIKRSLYYIILFSLMNVVVHALEVGAYYEFKNVTRVVTDTGNAPIRPSPLRVVCFVRNNDPVRVSVGVSKRVRFGPVFSAGKKVDDLTIGVSLQPREDHHLGNLASSNKDLEIWHLDPGQVAMVYDELIDEGIAPADLSGIIKVYFTADAALAKVLSVWAGQLETTAVTVELLKKRWGIERIENTSNPFDVEP